MRKFLTVMGAGVVAASALVGAADKVEAGTPYWCSCYGKAKRFIGATKACERTQHVKKCTAANFSAFKKQACASNGCKPR